MSVMMTWRDQTQDSTFSLLLMTIRDQDSKKNVLARQFLAIGLDRSSKGQQGKEGGLKKIRYSQYKFKSVWIMTAGNSSGSASTRIICLTIQNLAVMDLCADCTRRGCVYSITQATRHHGGADTETPAGMHFLEHASSSTE